MNAQEPLHQTHEVNLNQFLKKATNKFYNSQILTEIYKVVNIQAQGQQDGGTCSDEGFQGSQTNPV